MSKKCGHAAAAKKDDLIPLRNCIEGDAADNNSVAKAEESQSNEKNKRRSKEEAMIRKATVAYGIVELLVRCPKNNVALDDSKIQLDNFAVCVRKKSDGRSSSPQSPSSWDDIKGVRMLSSGLTLSIEEPSYLSCFFEEGEEKDDRMGRYLEVELDAAKALVAINCDSAKEDKESSKNRCHYLVAKILYELFTHEAFPDDNHNGGNEPANKKAKKAPFERGGGVGYSGKYVSDLFHRLSNIPVIERMQQLGVSAPVCRMMQNLLDSASGGGGGDAYKTLGEVGEDLHLLLFDPDRFLFDHEHHEARKMELLHRKDRLYGRDKEETLITDAFCRVTGGKNEAFFVGGFSGSGKSMLVDTLRVKVKNVGGYVIKHKFDAISQDKPLSGVISVVNQLCLKIKARLSSQRLAALSKKLTDDFGGDIGLLARMLPNICVLSPEFSSLTSKVEDGNTSDKMNARSVSFTLLRFMRSISSPKRPIMVSHSVNILVRLFFVS